MSSRLFPAAVVSVLALALACSSQKSTGGLQPCGPNGECPVGFVCNAEDNLCYMAGSNTPDAGLDAPVPDSRPVDMQPADARPDGGVLAADAPIPDARPVDAMPPDVRMIDAPPPDVRMIDAPVDAAPPPDAMPPQTTFDSTPDAIANSAVANFTFHSSIPGSTFVCETDGGAPTACVSGVTIGPLANGSHTFTVDAIGPSGVPDPTPASYSWRIDTIPPTTTITSGPSGTVAMADATFDFTASEAGTFQCKLDGAADFTACTSPETYSSLADGMHTFTVRAVDQAGNVDPAPPSRTWSIDSTNPTTTISAGPADPTNQVSATFKFAANDPSSTFQCQLDGAAYATCASPKTYAGPLMDGTHTFHVRSVTPAGVVDPHPATWTWTIDTTGPTVTITGGPTANSTTGPTVTFTYKADDTNVTFQCGLDNAGYDDCPPTGDMLTGLTEGPHTFMVYALDSLANAGMPATLTWTVDATGPTVTITSPTPGQRTAGNGTVTFSSEAGANTFECSLDGEAYMACDSTTGFAFGDLASGPHMVAIHASDMYGNIGSDTTVSWTVDSTGPTAIIDSAVSGFGKGGADFTFHSPDADATHFFCSLDGSTPADCSTLAANYGQLSPGTHAFAVYAVDDLGNQGATATRSVTVVLNTGHVVLIGHDYHGASANTPNPNDIIANAVTRLTSANGYDRAIKVLAFVGASTDATDHTQSLASLASGVAAQSLHSYSVDEFSTTTVSSLQSNLVGHDVLLIYDLQDSASSTALGTNWGTVLSNFVANGGVVVVLDGLVGTGTTLSATYEVLSALLPVTSELMLRAGLVVNVDTQDAVATNTMSYDVPANTVTYVIPADTNTTRAVSRDSGTPWVVAHKVFPNAP